MSLGLLTMSLPGKSITLGVVGAVCSLQIDVEKKRQAGVHHRRRQSTGDCLALNIQETSMRLE
jgi:hypothetical protein